MKATEFDRRFDAGEDLDPYVDWSTARRPNRATERLTDFDPAAHLSTEAAIIAFMSDALETNDPAYITHCLGLVARARGLPEMERQTHLFSATGNPTLRTVLALLDSCGLRLVAKPAGEV